MKRFAILICALLFLSAPARATPGGTDKNGGHTDKVTGEYHYHHGYPTHQHISGLCPHDVSYRGNTNLAKSAKRKGIGSEDQDDVVIAKPAKRADMFDEIETQGREGIIASAVVLAFICIGGFLSTVKKEDEDKKSDLPK